MRGELVSGHDLGRYGDTHDVAVELATIVRSDWVLVDASFNDPNRRAVAERLLRLAASNWTADVTFDLQDRDTIRLLNQHRVSTIIPSECLVSDADRALHRERLRHIYGVQMRLESTAAEVLGVLGEHGIEARVLKGLASAELDYPDRRLRQTGDVDLAIRPGETGAAIDVLKRNGCRDQLPLERSTHLLKGATLLASNGIEIDLHDRLFQRSPSSHAMFEQPGAPMSTLPGSALSTEQRLVHAAGHFILAPPGDRRMSGLLDVTRIIASHSIDLDRARAFACALKVGGLVAAALRLEAQLSHRVDGDNAYRDWPQPDWLERHTRLSPKRRLVLDQISRYREVPRDQIISYVPIWLLPDKRRRRLFVRSMTRSSRRLTARTRKRLP